MNCNYTLSILMLINNILGIVLLYVNGSHLIKQLLKMDELTELNNKITLTQKEYDLQSDTNKRQDIMKKLTKLRLRKQILELQ